MEKPVWFNVIENVKTLLLKPVTHIFSIRRLENSRPNMILLQFRVMRSLVTPVRRISGPRPLHRPGNRVSSEPRGHLEKFMDHLGSKTCDSSLYFENSTWGYFLSMGK